MTPFPSKLEFASLLQYSPRGTAEISQQSRDVTYAIKQDGVYKNRNMIDFIAEVVQQEFSNHPFLTDYFNSETTLVPIPRSGTRQPDALWPPLRICEALLHRGLARDILPCLERHTPLRRASTGGTRPNPQQHFDSIRQQSQTTTTPPTQITLVDDVITRGSSLVGMYPHLKAAYLGIPIRCFAVVRTESSDEVATIRDPTQGMVTYHSGNCVRRP